jgi:hypothetical protein
VCYVLTHSTLDKRVPSGTGNRTRVTPQTYPKLTLVQPMQSYRDRLRHRRWTTSFVFSFIFNHPNERVVFGLSDQQGCRYLRPWIVRPKSPLSKPPDLRPSDDTVGCVSLTNPRCEVGNLFNNVVNPLPRENTYVLIGAPHANGVPARLSGGS